MNQRALWSLVTLFIVLFVTSLWMSVLNGASSGAEIMSQAMSILAIAMAGFFILSRRYNNNIGWIFVGIALSVVFWTYSNEYAHFSLLTRPGEFPLGPAFAWLSLWSWTIHIWLIVVFLPLLYPDGRLLSTRWRVVAWFGCANMIATAGIAGLTPGVMDGLEPFSNPLGIGSNTGLWQFLGSLVMLPIIPTIALATISLIMRFRQSRAEQRAQIKWFLYVVMLFLLHAAYGISSEIGLVSELPFGLSSYIFSLLLAAFSFAIVIAILKYRLYDIDVIIRRTLQYALLTGLLALVYFSVVIVLENLLVWVTGQRSQVVIVISTLTIATLFTPLRRRVQNIIDWRFFRKRYDAEQSLATFAARSRAQVDIESLTGSLVTVIEQTVQPERVLLWLKPGEGKRDG